MLRRLAYYFFLALPLFVSLVWISQVAWADSVAQFTQTILPPAHSIDFVDESGQATDTAIVDLNVTTSSSQTQIVSSVLGTPNQKIHIINPALNSTWSVTVAATNGPDSVWAGTSSSYDYNNSVAGELTIDPSQADIEALPDDSSCPVAALFLGSRSSFGSGSVPIDNITIVNGSAVYSAFCAWNITGIQVQQLVPGGQAIDEYYLPLTLTII
jgi:hypothetical protein